MRCELLRSGVYLHSLPMLALDGLVSLKASRVVIRQLRALGIEGFPIPRYDAQTGTWQTQKTSALASASDQCLSESLPPSIFYVR